METHTDKHAAITNEIFDLGERAECLLRLKKRLRSQKVKARKFDDRYDEELLLIKEKMLQLEEVLTTL
jgi:hypothetical protein